MRADDTFTTETGKQGDRNGRSPFSRYRNDARAGAVVIEFNSRLQLSQTSKQNRQKISADQSHIFLIRVPSLQKRSINRDSIYSDFYRHATERRPFEHTNHGRVVKMLEPVKCLQGLRVLCVDDHQDSLTLLTGVLLRHGAQTIGCLSGSDALAVLKKNDFDVVVSDISMPTMDGFDLVHELRRMEEGDPHPTPTIALCGLAGKANKKRRFADFQVYLAKPFDRKNLVDVIKRLAEADGEAVAAGSLEMWEADQVASETVAASDSQHTAQVTR